MNQDVTTGDEALPVGPVKRSTDLGGLAEFKTRRRMRQLASSWDGKEESKKLIIRRALALGFTQAVSKIIWKKTNMSLKQDSTSRRPAKRESARATRARKRNDDLSLDQEPINNTIIFQEGVGAPEILQEEGIPDGAMRIRVPFYVGESINRPRGFSKKMYFPTSSLASIVEEGNLQVAEAKQPITVYARHSHATARDQLPIGDVQRMEQDGRIGYAVIDVMPTIPHGQNVQMLTKSGKLNAVSMRSEPGSYKLGKGKINGEEVLVFETGSHVNGIDFAPDGPAQPTFGIEILNEQARVEPSDEKKDDRRMKLPDADITRDDVPNDVVAEIERPLRDELKALQEKVGGLQQEKNLRERDDYLRELSKNTSDAEEGYKAMVALCNEKKVATKKEAAEAVTPILLEALAEMKKTPSEPKVSREEQIRKLFNPTASAAGHGVVKQDDEEEEKEESGPVTEEREMSVGGLAIPGEE